MKKVFKPLLAAFLFALVTAAFLSLGTVNAAAATLSSDLDGDGTDETIIYETSETEDDGIELTSLTINGIDALASGKLEHNFDACYLSVEVIDTCTKDGLKELAVIKRVDNWTEYNLFRFKNGKVSKYCTVNADEIISQKKKNRITIKGYVFVQGLGNIYVNTNLKVKSGRAVLIDEPSKPNKDNATIKFKTNRKMTLYSDEYVTEEIGTIKKGAKFKLIKFERDGEGNFTRICVKANGVTGWIDTTDIDGFFVNNPPLWD